MAHLQFPAPAQKVAEKGEFGITVPLQLGHPLLTDWAIERFDHLPRFRRYFYDDAAPIC